MRSLLLLTLMAGVVLANPPGRPGFLRMDELEPKLSERLAKLQKAEAFRRKPRLERMIIRFEQGAESFEGKKFSDQKFVDELLVRWADVQKPEEQCQADHVRILSLLPNALRTRYDVVPIPKKERYAASKVLVKGLRSKHDIIRRISIECLSALYGGRTLMYRHDAQPGMRNERARKWKAEIEALKK